MNNPTLPYVKAIKQEPGNRILLSLGPGMSQQIAKCCFRLIAKLNADIVHIPAILSTAIDELRQLIPEIETISGKEIAEALQDNLDKVNSVNDMDAAMQLRSPSFDSEFMETYAATGIPVPDQKQIDYYSVWGFTWLNALLLSAASAFKSGTTADIQIGYVSGFMLPRLQSELADELR